VRLVDVRSREEFDAVHIEGAVLLSQDVMRKWATAPMRDRW
jgi:rhodanese-related sulfurtransferase